MPDRGELRSIGGAVAATAALIVLLTWGWSGLWFEPPTGALVIGASVAMVPAIIRATRRRGSVAGAIAATVVGAAIVVAAAVEANIVDVLRRDRETLDAIGAAATDGLANAATTALPLVGDDVGPLSAVLVVVLAAGAAVVAWQGIVSRRPLTAIVAAVVGLAYRWTLVPPQRPVLFGLITLAVALTVLRLAAPRTRRQSRPGRAAVAATAIVAVAAVGSLGAEGSTAWWNWRSWTFGSSSGPTVLTLKQTYGPLVYPSEPVVLARLETDRIMSLKAVTLKRFDGNAFAEAPPFTVVDGTVDRGTLVLRPDPPSEGSTLRQRLTLVKTRTPWLFVGGDVSRISGLGSRRARVLDDGTIRLEPSIGPNATYEMSGRLADPGAAALLRVKDYSATELDPEYFLVAPGRGSAPVVVPPWGSGGPAPAADDFGSYASVARLAREVVGDARTPYEAVNRVEGYLRSPQRFTYNEKTPRPVGTPDLVDFLLNTQTGYCQQFAGSMALMLRINGIPARVAVGLTTNAGRYDAATGSYTIVDRDAHSWVEVYFPGQGWLPFDPTPGRSAPNTASVSSPGYKPPAGSVDVAPDLAQDPIAPATPPDVRDPDLRNRPSSSSGSGSGHAWAWVAGTLGSIVLLLGAAPVAKAVRRRRRRSGDERRQVLGAARELESLLTDLGRPVDPSATPAERSRLTWRELGIDSSRIYELAGQARFSPQPPAEGAGRTAWADLRAARRSIRRRSRLHAQLRLRSLRTRPPASSEGLST